MLPEKFLHKELRDEIALRVISSLMTKDRNRKLVYTPKEAAKLAYEYADAMLEARRV